MRKLVRNRGDYIGRLSKESLKSTVDTYKLVLPEYLSKPFVKQRQRMHGQLQTLSKNASALSHLHSHSSLESIMPMQISSKVLNTVTSSQRNIPLTRTINASPAKPPQ